MVSKISDLELDALQPCFCPDKDDFCLCRSDSATPDEDIWKTFELLPTTSLSRSPAGLQEHSPGNGPVPWGEAALGDCHPTDPMDWASELLLLPPEADLQGGVDGGDFFETGPGVSNNLESIIQDCMWSGFSAREKLEQAVSDSLQSSVPAAPPPPPGASGSPDATDARMELGDTVLECVDPAVIFPFPINNFEAPAAGGWAPRGGRSPRPAWDSRANSSSSSTRDDDKLRDSDEKEEDERCFHTKKSTNISTIRACPKNTTSSSVRKQENGLIINRCAPIHDKNNYVAPPPFVETEEAPPQKKLKIEVPCPEELTIQPKPESASPLNAASENSTYQNRRRILERQRRHDLQSSFHRLRDLVPELVKYEKATRIMILKRATEYIHSLQAEEQKLLLEKENLQARQEQLLKKLD